MSTPLQPVPGPARDRTGMIVLAAKVCIIAALVCAVVLGFAVRHLDRIPVATPDRGAPVWPAPADPVPGMRAAGLDALAEEGTVQHRHAHLDIIVNGTPVLVPAHIGISGDEKIFSEVHTHDTTGILHVESDVQDRSFTLGQVFTEWGVRLDEYHLGELVDGPDGRLTAYMDGHQMGGDPADIYLSNHSELVLVFSPGEPGPVPSDYDFAAHGV